MAPDDVEKTGDLDGTESTANSEKIGPGMLAETAYGEPDSDHEEVEQMDEGHLDDLARQQVSSNSRVETFCLSPLDCSIDQCSFRKRRELPSQGSF
jgi:hypothetical protein